MLKGFGGGSHTVSASIDACDGPSDIETSYTITPSVVCHEDKQGWTVMQEIQNTEKMNQLRKKEMHPAQAGSSLTRMGLLDIPVISADANKCQGLFAGFPLTVMKTTIDLAEAQLHEDKVAIDVQTSPAYIWQTERPGELFRALFTLHRNLTRAAGRFISREEREHHRNYIGYLKSGAAYVPIDPIYPDERARFVLDDTQAKVIIANNHLAEISKQDPSLTFLLAMGRRATITKPFLLFSAHVFEPFVRQMLMSLVNGHLLAMVDDAEKYDTGKLIPFISKQKFTYVNVTASVLQGYDFSSCPSLTRMILVGGNLTEARYLALRRHFKNRILNEHGFAESAFVTALNIFKPGSARNNSSLGRRVRNVKGYILNQSLKWVPIGATGRSASFQPIPNGS
ncbi:hypothetical protein BDW60DRAFT_212227 [Aspergillus nidulans var. acristatus]